MAEPEFNWKDAEIVDFKVVNEGWQYYNLSDEARVKVKLVLVQVWRSRSQYNSMTGEPYYWWNTQNTVSIVSFPEKLRGQASSLPLTPEALAKSIEQVVDFEASGKEEEWNVYNLTDESILRLRLNLTSISRTKLRGKAGEPIYGVSGGLPNFRLKVASKLIKKPSVPPPTTSSAYG
jgi:hypothetical protein